MFNDTKMKHNIEKCTVRSTNSARVYFKPVLDKYFESSGYYYFHKKEKYFYHVPYRLLHFEEFLFTL